MLGVGAVWRSAGAEQQSRDMRPMLEWSGQGGKGAPGRLELVCPPPRRTHSSMSAPTEPATTSEDCDPQCGVRSEASTARTRYFASKWPDPRPAAGTKGLKDVVFTNQDIREPRWRPAVIPPVRSKLIDVKA